jgi:hypothetical protein
MIDKHSEKPLDVILAKEHARRVRKLMKRHDKFRDLWSGKKLPDTIVKEILKDRAMSEKCRRTRREI